MGGWNLLGGLMPPAVDTAGESERRHSRDSGNAEEFEILEREEVEIAKRRRSEDSGNCSEAEKEQDTNRVIELEFQLTQSLLSQVKAGENNRDANSGKQAQLDLKRMSFVINGKEISKEYVGKLYIKCNHLIPSENEDYRPFAKQIFTGMFKHAKAEIPNDNVLEELITNCNQAGYEFAVYGHIHPILDQYGLIPTIPQKTVSLCCNSAGCIDVEYSDVIVVKNPDQLRQYEAFSKLEFTLKSQGDRAEYENGKVTLTIPKELENYKADGKSLLDDIKRHFVDVDNTIIESLVENIGEGPKSFVVNLPAEVNSDSFDVISEKAVFDLGHIAESVKKAVNDKDVDALATHIGFFQDHVTNVSPKEGLSVVEKTLKIVSDFVEGQGKVWNRYPTVPIANHIYSAKQYCSGYISQADYEKVENLKKNLCKIKSDLIKRSNNDHNVGPSVTNAQDTSAILNETPISSQAVDRKDGNQLNTKESKNQQLQSSIVGKGENIIANKKASKEATINRRGKMPKNTKTIEKKLSDAINSIDLPSVAKLLVPPNNKVDKLILQKSLNQANNKIQSLKESKKKENQERNLRLIIKLLTERLEETVSVGNKADCSSTTKSSVMNGTDSQQPRENVVDKGENIINSEKASEEAIVNNCEEGKMPKNTKTIEEKLSDAIFDLNYEEVISLVEQVKQENNSVDAKQILSKALKKANDTEAGRRDKNSLDKIKEIREFLTKELEHTAALPAGDDVGATASSQEIPVVELKESSPSLSSEEDDFSKLESDGSARISSDSPSFDMIDDETETPKTAELEATAAMPSMVTEEKLGNINDKEDDTCVSVSSDQRQDAQPKVLASELEIENVNNDITVNQSAGHVEQMANEDTQSELVVAAGIVSEIESDSPSLSSEDDKLRSNDSARISSGNGSPFEVVNDEIGISVIETTESVATAITSEIPSMVTGEAKSNNEQSNNLDDAKDNSAASNSVNQDTSAQSPVNDSHHSTRLFTHNSKDSLLSQPSSLDFANESVNTVISIDNNREEQVFNQPAGHIEQMAKEDTQPEPDEQGSKSNQKTTVSQNTKKYIVAASALAITGIALGVAVAVYLEMLAIGIAIAACCLIAATITYCVRPQSLIEDNQVKKVMQTEECQSK